MKFLITGAAGFIGHKISLALLEAGHSVVGIDNLNDYYDPALKLARLHRISGYEAFRFEQLDISEHDKLLALPERDHVDRVIHLAARPLDQAAYRLQLHRINDSTHINALVERIAHAQSVHPPL